MWQEHSWKAAIPQMEEEEACQVTWALISQTEDGHLDIHSCMRSKWSWIKSFICPVIDKHPEENGISGKRKEAALYWVCMWLGSLRRATRAGLPWPFPLDKPCCLSLYLYRAALPGVCFSLCPHGERPEETVVSGRVAVLQRWDPLCR